MVFPAVDVDFFDAMLLLLTFFASLICLGMAVIIGRSFETEQPDNRRKAKKWLRQIEHGDELLSGKPPCDMRGVFTESEGDFNTRRFTMNDGSFFEVEKNNDGKFFINAIRIIYSQEDLE